MDKPTMTFAQVLTLTRKHQQDHQGLTLKAFINSTQPLPFEKAVTVQWCGMWLCIETDGYCHT